MFEELWRISFRIHNASSKVKTSLKEVSLKFDLQFVGFFQVFRY
ncbi:HaeIII family restriction endonuclease [Bartonella rattimassiliensis]